MSAEKPAIQVETTYAVTGGLDPATAHAVLYQPAMNDEAMTRDELLDALRALHDHPDTEGRHIKADELLLEYIGDEEIAAAFEALPRWYA